MGDLQVLQHAVIGQQAVVRLKAIALHCVNWQVCASPSAGTHGHTGTVCAPSGRHSVKWTYLLTAK